MDFLQKLTKHSPLLILIAFEVFHFEVFYVDDFKGGDSIFNSNHQA